MRAATTAWMFRFRLVTVLIVGACAQPSGAEQALADAPNADGSTENHVQVPIVEAPINPNDPASPLFQSVMIKVGETELPVMLDTGSPGLRVFRSVLGSSDYVLTDVADSFSFASGLTISGSIGMATVSIGGLETASPIPLQIITGYTGRMGQSPNPGPIDGLFGIMGIEISGSTYAANPLDVLGSRVFVVDIAPPWSGSTTGTLTLNPTSADLEGFTTFQLASTTKVVTTDPPPTGTGSGWATNSLQGCIDDTDAGSSFCQNAIMDSGAWGFHDAGDVAGSAVTSWSTGTHASLRISDSQGADSLTLPFTVGSNPGSSVSLPPTASPTAVLNTGPFPFFNYSIYYDGGRGVLGMKAQ